MQIRLRSVSLNIDIFCYLTNKRVTSTSALREYSSLRSMCCEGVEGVELRSAMNQCSSLEEPREGRSYRSSVYTSLTTCSKQIPNFHTNCVYGSKSDR